MKNNIKKKFINLLLLEINKFKKYQVLSNGNNRLTSLDKNNKCSIKIDINWKFICNKLLLSKIIYLLLNKKFYV